MHTPARLLTLAVLASLTMLAPPLGTASAAERPSGRPGLDVTTYDGTFVGDLTWRHRAEYGGPDFRADSADIDVTSTLPGVRFADGKLLGSPGGGAVTVRGRGESRTVTDESNHVINCAGDTVNPTTSVAPYLVPVVGRPTFYAFTSLSLIEECSYETEPRTYTARILMPAVPVPVTISPEDIGTARITVPIDRTMPKERCLNHHTETTTCTYRLHGTLTLRLVPDIGIFEPPTKPVLKRGATKASIRTRCTAACSATLEVRPLRGSGRATTRSQLKAGAGKTLSVKPGAKLRRSIDRSGGARLTVTYRSGSLSKTYTRKVALLSLRRETARQGG